MDNIRHKITLLSNNVNCLKGFGDEHKYDKNRKRK